MNFIGSTCDFSCNIRYARSGSPTSTCVEAGNQLSWDKPVPVCQGKLNLFIFAVFSFINVRIFIFPEKSCPNVLPAPQNGTKICSKMNYLDSKCDFSCDENFRIVGVSSSTCVEVDGKLYWNNPVPVCKRTFVFKLLKAR